MIGEPSTQLMKNMGDEEKARTANQVEQLGASGLKEKAGRLQKATEENEVHASYRRNVLHKLQSKYVGNTIPIISIVVILCFNWIHVLIQVEPPKEMLLCVDVPDVGCIKFHKINPSDNHDSSAANTNEKFPLADIPVAFQLDDIQTNFAAVSLICIMVMIYMTRIAW